MELKDIINNAKEKGKVKEKQKENKYRWYLIILIYYLNFIYLVYIKNGILLSI